MIVEMPRLERMAAFVWLASAIAPMAACRRDNHRTTGPTMTFAHPNGLSLALPERLDGRSLSVKQTETGFDIQDGRSARYVTHVIVDLRAGATAPPGAFPKTRAIGGRTIHYVVAEAEGPAGSGGPEYDLRAWEPARGGHVAYASREQTEGEPDFSLAWTVIERLTPPP